MKWNQSRAFVILLIVSLFSFAPQPARGLGLLAGVGDVYEISYSAFNSFSEVNGSRVDTLGQIASESFITNAFVIRAKLLSIQSNEFENLRINSTLLAQENETSYGTFEFSSDSWFYYPYFGINETFRIEEIAGSVPQANEFQPGSPIYLQNTEINSQHPQLQTTLPNVWGAFFASNEIDYYISSVQALGNILNGKSMFQFGETDSNVLSNSIFYSYDINSLKNEVNVTYKHNLNISGSQNGVNYNRAYLYELTCKISTLNNLIEVFTVKKEEIISFGASNKTDFFEIDFTAAKIVGATSTDAITTSSSTSSFPISETNTVADSSSLLAVVLVLGGITFFFAVSIFLIFALRRHREAKQKNYKAKKR